MTSLPIAFLKGKYGVNYLGHLSLWLKSTKKTTYFSSQEWSALEKFLDDHVLIDDVYVALGTQAERLAPHERGSARSVVGVPGFFADIDFRGDQHSSKRYPLNQEEALSVLDSFEIKPTTIVATGNGLHAHFEFSESYWCDTVRERRRIDKASKSFQRKLHAHFAERDLEIDSVGDLARLYRLPGTFNHKTSPAKEVAILLEDGPRQSFEGLEKFLEEARVARTERTENKKSSHDLICKGCSWYRRVIVEGAASCDEPNWFAGASITARCRNGREIFMQYSAQHPDFKDRDAEKKFDRAIEEGGPRTCQSIEEDLGYDGCKTCVHRGQITSPIQIGHGYDAGSVGPVPIGYMGSEFLFRNQQTKEIVKRTAGQLISPPGLIELAPFQFWATSYGRRNPYGQIVGVDWVAACNGLIQACRAQGAIEASSIRGIGVWEEKGRLIVNLGGEVIDSSLYHYTSPRLIKLDRGSIPVELIFEFLNQPKWKADYAPELLFGWAYASVISGALRWRPHVGLTGPAQSGKSTIMRGIGHILWPLALVREGISTEAGIRQSLGYDARPTLLDELEPESSRDRGRIERIVKLMRSSSSADGTIARGTVEGRAINFSTRSMFLVGAINLYRISAADTSRLVKLELDRHDAGETRQSNASILHLIKKLDGVGSAFCQHAIDHAAEILASIDIVHGALPVVQERQADNLATLLAASWVAKNGREISKREARTLAGQFPSMIEDQRDGVELSDDTEALNVLLGTSVSVSTENEGEDGSYTSHERFALGVVIASVLQNSSSKVEATKAANSGSKRTPAVSSERLEEAVGSFAIVLQQHGIKIDGDGFLVSNTHPGLTKIFRGTRWEGGLWGSALARVPGAKRTTQRRFSDGVRSLATWLPRECLPPIPKRRF